MSRIPKGLSELLEKVGETPQSALWDCHGTSVIKHKALEKVATLLQVVFNEPTIIESNARDKIAVVCVKGQRTIVDKDNKEHKIEAWSFGEATPYNNKNSYPFAMAEKRAIDRVLLKLIGIHGYMYSEIEADDFKKENN